VSRMFYLAILVAMVLALVVSPAVAAPGEPTGKAARNGGPSNNYVVNMADAPVVAYDGGITGYPATKPGNCAANNVSPNKRSEPAMITDANGIQNSLLACVTAGNETQ